MWLLVVSAAGLKRIACHTVSSATWQPGRSHEPGHARDDSELAPSTLRCRASLLTRHQPLAVVIVLRTK